MRPHLGGWGAGWWGLIGVMIGAIVVCALIAIAGFQVIPDWVPERAESTAGIYSTTTSSTTPHWLDRSSLGVIRPWEPTSTIGTMTTTTEPSLAPRRLALPTIATTTTTSLARTTLVPIAPIATAGPTAPSAAATTTTTTRPGSATTTTMAPSTITRPTFTVPPTIVTTTTTTTEPPTTTTAAPPETTTTAVLEPPVFIGARCPWAGDKGFTIDGVVLVCVATAGPTGTLSWQLPGML